MYKDNIKHTLEKKSMISSIKSIPKKEFEQVSAIMNNLFSNQSDIAPTMQAYKDVDVDEERLSTLIVMLRSGYSSYLLDEEDKKFLKRKVGKNWKSKLGLV